MAIQFNPLTGFDTTTHLPETPLQGGTGQAVMDAPEWEIPQTEAGNPVAGNPLLKTFGPDPSIQADEDYDQSVAKWRRDTLAKLETAALEPEKFYAGDDLSFAKTPDEARMLATNDAYLH